MKIIGLIPVRIESIRLPNKAILEIGEMPMILHVAKRAKLSKVLDRLIVCTDSHIICDICINNQIDVVLTKTLSKYPFILVSETTKTILCH